MKPYDELTPPERAVYDEARELIEGARALGVVVTIERVPLQPPAMGNYELQISVDEMRR